MNQQQNGISFARMTSLDGKVSSYDPCQTPTLSAKFDQRLESNLNPMFYPTSKPMSDPILISGNYSMFYPTQKNKNRFYLNVQKGICLTGPFHLDRASLLCRCARQGEQGVLGKPSGWIPLRELSATDQLQISSFPGWGISSLEPRQTPTRFLQVGE